VNRLPRCSLILAAVLSLSRPAWVCAQTPPLSPTASPSAPPSPPPEAEKLALTVDAAARLTLPVMIDGQGPFPFLIDTGSDRTVISRELATRLNLAAGPQVTMHESTGVADVGTVVVRRLSFGQTLIDRIEAPDLAAANLGAAGFLGLDSLRDLQIEMDFAAMRLTVSPSRPEPFDPDNIVVHGRSRFGQLILVDAQVRGQRVYVVLDTGAEISIGNPALLRALNGPTSHTDPTGRAEIFSVTGRQMAVDVQTVSRADIGGLVIVNLPIAFAQLHTFDRFGLTRQPALLLGMDVLSKCRRVVVDLRRREAVFTLR